MTWVRKQHPHVLDVTASTLQGRNRIQNDLDKLKQQYEKQNYSQLEPGAKNYTEIAEMNKRNWLCRK